MFSRVGMASKRVAFNAAAISRKPLITKTAKFSTTKVTRAPASGFVKFAKNAWKATWISALLGVGYLGYSIYDESKPKANQVKHSELTPSGNKKKNLVILGSGWGSISLLKNLDTTLYNVTIISPRNYFLFTPLLPSVPTGTVDLKSIVEPVRTITRRSNGEVIYIEAEATSIDPATKTITYKHTKDHEGNPVDSRFETSISYDYLVVGVGAKVGTFGTPGVDKHACFLKEGYDSTKIRRKLLDCIEQANLLPEDDPERKRLLTTIVVGGGPTGVELAGELQDYVEQDLSRWVPTIAPQIKVTLLEAMPKILAMFDKTLIDYAAQILAESNIDLQTNTMVKKVDETNVYASVKQADGSSKMVTLPYGLLVWATGNATREVITDLFKKIPEQANARRGLLLDDYLKVQGSDDIYALGDCTFTKYAPTAQVAHQEGVYLAELFHNLAKVDELKFELSKSVLDTEKTNKLNRKLTRASKLEPFKYVHFGALAYIGSEKAIADLTWKDWQTFQSGGLFTYIFWKTAYVSMCLSVRNKVLVCVDWSKTAIFGRDTSN
ncbi:NADH-ubiquinone reductase (H(+)-translocating) [Saccharomycopsis crataegensis]|uniref:NADH:ubiquinone reductase (non-electrogenic) n=1 Tax=Saccharomycopsis crataegensis TaxID=43959 RepID=A0AAV5QP78_9ASCO|nr:NADH-ubiquinone reductase (H(+)-translocating) [Saccharomycopsis crataegensis]